MKKHCVHAYIGEGKGKSTAAAGLCLRARGAGMNVAVVQLLKHGSSENSILEKLGVKLIAPVEDKFCWDMDETERAQASKRIDEAIKRAKELANEGYELIVFDEILGACEQGLISQERLIELTKLDAEVVFTGRRLPEALYPLCDYISEILPIAHPYKDGGVGARRGIEY